MENTAGKRPLPELSDDIMYYATITDEGGQLICRVAITKVEENHEYDRPYYFLNAGPAGYRSLRQRPVRLEGIIIEESSASRGERAEDGAVELLRQIYVPP